MQNSAFAIRNYVYPAKQYSNVRLKKTGRGTEIGQRALRDFLNRDVKFRPSGTEIPPELRTFLNRDVDATHQFF